MKSAICLISGFTQRERADDANGIVTLRRELAETYFDRRQHWLGLRTWRANMEDTAGLMLEQMPAKIIVVAYSWGAGRGVPRLCQHLPKVDLLCLIDPVLYAWPRALALLRFGKFRVPDNVRRVATWRTENGSALDPKGRAIAHPASQKVRDIVLTRDRLGKHVWRDDATHVTIDNHPQIHEEIRELISREIDHV